MVRTVLLLYLVITLSAGLADANTRRIVLLEEATNASCPPCATYNPQLQEFFAHHFGGVVSVRYHAWWPGVDPMYDHNVVDNTARIDYYGINGVPNYLMDGVNYGVPSDQEAMASQMRANLANPSPVMLDIVSEIDADSVRATITLIGDATVDQSMLYLRTTIIERLIVYDSPPGSNGETEFPDVMRKMLPDATGISIPSISPGDTLTYQFSYPVHEEWVWEDLAVVSWLQSDATQEVLQSNIDLPTYVIDSSGPAAAGLNLNDEYTQDYSITNDNPDTLNLNISLETISAPEGWLHDLVFEAQMTDSMDVTLAPGETVEFQLHIQTGSEPDGIKLRIFAENLDDPYGYGFSAGFFGIITQGTILYVNDAGQYNYEEIFAAGFENAGMLYTSVSEADLLALANELDFSQFEHLFWNVSWSFPAFVPEDIVFIQNFLDGGGNLFLTGQDIGWDTFDDDGNTNFPEAQDFYHNYLDANYLGDDSGIYSMEGIAGDPITDGLAFNITNIYSQYPENIASYSGQSVPILMYTGSSLYGALRYDAEDYKVIYLGIGLEQISDQEAAELMVERALAWFVTVSGDGPEPVVLRLDLAQNVPNPFDIETMIRYQLPALSHVSLTVYDAAGHAIRTLVDDRQPAGHQSAIWDGKNNTGQRVGSGVYFCKLTVGSENITRKMTILR
jgi:hypothetical protein